MASATATGTSRKMLIDGKWCLADSGRTLAVTNPATEEVVAEVAYKDIFTMADRKAALKGQPSGLSASKLNKKQM